MTMVHFDKSMPCAKAFVHGVWCNDDGKQE